MSVRVEVTGPAAVVTLAWSQKRNALGAVEADEVTAALAEAGAAAPTAVILTGDGAFCAGGDLPAIAELAHNSTRPEIRDHVYGRFQALVRALRDSPVPTIAAVDGPAVGLGLDLALACDMRFVGPSGWVQQGWARAGLIAGTGGIGLVGRLDPDVLWELLATSDRLGPEACARLRLAVAADPSATEVALERAELLSRYDREVLGHYARLHRATTWPRDDHFADSADTQSGLLAGEGFRRFTENLFSRS